MDRTPPGSNGPRRLATHGCLRTEDGDVGIDVLCLEEDSARKLETRSTDNGEEVEWNLDRLGVPLLELATAPDVRTPEHARTTAAALGRRLRDRARSGAARRHPSGPEREHRLWGSRRDQGMPEPRLDPSHHPARDGPSVATSIDWRTTSGRPMTCRLCPRIVDWMTPRWRHASAAQATELLPVAPIDVSAAFAGCDSAMVRRGLDEHGHAMHGIVLPGFHGLLGTKRTDVEGLNFHVLGVSWRPRRSSPESQVCSTATNSQPMASRRMT